MRNIKEISIKYQTYHFLNDMIRTKNVNPELRKIDKNSYTNIDIYYIGYITMKDADYVSIRSVNPFYFIIDKADGNIEESNRKKYLTLVSNDKNKDIMKKYTEIWGEIKILMKQIHDEFEKF